MPHMRFTFHVLWLLLAQDEHRELREMVRTFTTREVEPQALQFNREERLNMDLFKRAGELGVHISACVQPARGLRVLS